MREKERDRVRRRGGRERGEGDRGERGVRGRERYRLGGVCVRGRGGEREGERKKEEREWWKERETGG